MRVFEVVLVRGVLHATAFFLVYVLHCDRVGVCHYESGNNISKLGSMFYKTALSNIPISFSIFFLIFYRKNTKKIYNSFVILHIFSIL